MEAVRERCGACEWWVSFCSFVGVFGGDLRLKAQGAGREIGCRRRHLRLVARWLQGGVRCLCLRGKEWN